MQNHPATNTCSVLELLDRVGDKKVQPLTLGILITELDSVGFGPLMLVPSLLGIAIGGVPMLNTVCAVLIIMVAAQALWGRPHPWLPERLRAVTMDKGKYKKAVDILRPTLAFVEKHAHRRLIYLTTGPAQRIVAFLCILLGISIIILDLLPFAAALPSGAIAFMALGLTLKDGLYMIASALLILGGLWVVL